MGQQIDIAVTYSAATLIRGPGDVPEGDFAVVGEAPCLFATPACSLPIVAEVTATYTGNDPGGVALWKWCTDPAPFGGCGAGADRSECELVGEGACLEDSYIVGDATTHKPIRVISASATTSTARLYIGAQANPGYDAGDPDSPEHFRGLSPEGPVSMLGPYFRVFAQTDRGDSEEVQFKAAYCRHEVVEEDGVAKLIGDLECPGWRYRVLGYVDAGPSDTSTPSGLGQIARVEFIRCEAADNESAPTLLQSFTDCCEGNGDLLGSEAQATVYCSAGGPTPCVQPRGAIVSQPAGVAWDAAKLDPNVLNVVPGVPIAPADHPPEAAGKNLQDYALFEIALGQVVSALIGTPTHDWDLSGVDLAGPVSSLQESATVRYPQANGEGFLDYQRCEAPVVLGGSADESSPERRRVRTVDTKVLSTGHFCKQCCPCDGATGLVYELTAQDVKLFDCDATAATEPPPLASGCVQQSETNEYRVSVWTRRTDLEDPRCGARIALPPYILPAIDRLGPDGTIVGTARKGAAWYFPTLAWGWREQYTLSSFTVGAPWTDVGEATRLGDQLRCFRLDDDDPCDVQIELHDRTGLDCFQPRTAEPISNNTGDPATWSFCDNFYRVINGHFDAGEPAYTGDDFDWLPLIRNPNHPDGWGLAQGPFVPPPGITIWGDEFHDPNAFPAFHFVTPTADENCDFAETVERRCNRQGVIGDLTWVTVQYSVPPEDVPGFFRANGPCLEIGSDGLATINLAVPSTHASIPTTIYSEPTTDPLGSIRSIPCITSRWETTEPGEAPVWVNNATLAAAAAQVRLAVDANQ